MIAKTYICDDCGARGTFTSYLKARAAHWAVAKDYAKCYCPVCAPKYRRGKAAEKNVEVVTQLYAGFKQLSINLK